MAAHTTSLMHQQHQCLIHPVSRQNLSEVPLPLMLCSTAPRLITDSWDICQLSRRSPLPRLNGSVILRRLTGLNNQSRR